LSSDGDTGVRTPGWKRLWDNLQRRQVFRTAALYAVGAWGLVQVADVLLP